MLTFATWLRYPNEPEAVRYGQLIAAANVLLHLKENSRNQKHFVGQEFSTVELARFIFDPPPVGPFYDVFDHVEGNLSDVGCIAGYFCGAPAKPLPSLNRALHLISKGGFVDNFGVSLDQQEKGPSVATLKTSWRRYAVVAPFVLAAHVELNLIDLPPDHESSVGNAKQLLRRSNSLQRYFGVARHAQEKMLLRLNARSKERFTFVHFPNSIKPVEFDFELDEIQLRIIAEYLAPMPAY